MSTFVTNTREDQRIDGFQTRIIRAVLGLTPPWVREEGEFDQTVSFWRQKLNIVSWSNKMRYQRFTQLKSLLTKATSHPMRKVLVPSEDQWEFQTPIVGMPGPKRITWFEAACADGMLSCNEAMELSPEDVAKLKPCRLLMQQDLEQQLRASTSSDKDTWPRHLIRRSIRKLRFVGCKRGSQHPSFYPDANRDNMPGLRPPFPNL